MSLPASTKRSAAWLLSASLVMGLLLAAGPYAGTARACSCVGPPDPVESLRSSDVVFSGQVVRGGVGDPEPEDGTLMGGIEFRVIEAWKGVSGKSVVLYGQEDAYYGDLEEGQMVPFNSCSYPFEKDGRYLVYAYRSGGDLQTTTCDRTATLASADEDLRALGPPEERLMETGGPPLPLVDVLVGAAGLASAGLLFRWACS